eukprot:6894901-Pyramimonas_sp.AAC.1
MIPFHCWAACCCTSLIRATRLVSVVGWAGGGTFGRRPRDNGLAATGDVQDGGTKRIAHEACGA